MSGKREALDADTAEVTTINDRDPLPHCFIVRLDDELFDVVLRHQNRLACALNCEVSRAAAVREVLRRALPKKRPQRTTREQLSLWGKPLNRDPLVGVMAEQALERAEDRRKRK